MKRRIEWESQHLEDEPEDDDSDVIPYDEDDESGPSKLRRAMLTPVGMFRVDDKLANPYKQFQIWMGHTNFILDEATVKKIATTPGVELLKILSPYRFICSPGRLFKWGEVADLIQQRICTNKHDKIIDDLQGELKTNVKTLVTSDLKDKTFWRIYVFPNGEIYHKTYEGLNDYQSGKPEFSELKQVSQGIIITSE